MPFMTFSVNWNRSPVTSTTSVGVVPAGADLSAFLNSILVTRYPNPAERNALVSNLMATRGLNTSVPGTIDIMANYAQLQNRVRARPGFSSGLAIRDAVGLPANAAAAHAVGRVGHRHGPAGSDNQQTGATLSLNRRLTPQMSIGPDLHAVEEFAGWPCERAT